MPKPDATHGNQPPSVPEFLKPGGGTHAPEKTFHCPLWPGCNCPDGTVHPDCPGLERQIGAEELQLCLSHNEQIHVPEGDVQ